MSAEREVAWRPDADVVERAQLTRFLRQTGFHTYEDVYRWSVTDVAGFTEQVLRFLKIPFDVPPQRIVDLSRGPEWPQWCLGGSLNISAAALDPHPTDRPAVLWEGEEGSASSLSYGELRDEVSAAAGYLTACGIGRGDAVAIFLPMIPETVAALLACARVGAIA